MKNIGVKIARLDSALRKEEKRRTKFLETVDRMHLVLETRAAAGDAEAAQILAAADDFRRATLAFVPNPDRPGYVTLEWIVPNEETPQEAPAE